MRTEQRLAVHYFNGLDDLQFDPVEYSKLKFGSDIIARRYGHELADTFFREHADVLLSMPAVVIPSPYNYVQNAASVMARHFTNRLNHHLGHANGNSVEWTVIHRKVTYTNDYGFLSADQRKALIDGDSFYFNNKFVEGKLLIFIDDVYITGTHERKLAEIMDTAGMRNRCFYLYYGMKMPGTNPDVEAAINLAGIKDLRDYAELMLEPNHHIIVRPLKFLLSQPVDELRQMLHNVKTEVLEEMYHGCLGEGYHRIPRYHDQFQVIRGMLYTRIV